MKINDHYLNLSSNYLFADIAKKVQAFKAENSKADVISLGIGDVTQPLCFAVVEALHKAADEMAVAATFRGYGPERGYDFLHNAIVENDYRSRGIDINADEVFVSDGYGQLSGTAGRGLRDGRYRSCLSCIRGF